MLFCFLLNSLLLVGNALRTGALAAPGSRLWQSPRATHPGQAERQAHGQESQFSLCLQGFFAHLLVQSPLKAVGAEPVTASWTINFPTELRQRGEVWDIYFSQVSSVASGAKCDLLPKVARRYRWVSSVLLLSARKRRNMTLINYNLRPKPHL